MILVYGPLAAAALGVWMVYTALHRHARPSQGEHHPGAASGAWGGIRAPVLATIGGVLIVLGLGFAVLGLNMQPYARLKPANPVAIIAVKALYPVAKTYSVTVTRLDGVRRTTTCILHGDEWALTGARQTWRWWVIGHPFATTYAVERIVSRSATPQTGRANTACDLRLPRPKLTLYLPGSLIRTMLTLALASEHPLGQALFRPLSDGALYRVEVMPEGFVSTPQLIPPQMADAG